MGSLYGSNEITIRKGLQGIIHELLMRMLVCYLDNHSIDILNSFQGRIQGDDQGDWSLPKFDHLNF